MIDEKRLIKDIEKEFDGVCVYDVSPSQAVNDFVEIVDRQPKVGWIPCSERLPEEPGSYLITARTISGIRYVRPGLLYSNGKFGRDSVIAWQPLPKPYEEDNYESNNSSI